MALPIIDAPTFELNIPGRSTATVFRPFLVKEDKLLTLAAESGETSEMVNACIQVVNNCSLGEIDAKELAMYQLQWTFLELRKRSIGELQNYVLSCGGCKNKINYEMSVSEFEIKGDTESDRKEIKVNEDISLVIRYPKCTEQAEIADMSDAEILRVCMESITNGEENINPAEESAEELDDFIDSLPLSVVEEAEKFFTEMPFLAHNIEYTCKACNKENFVVINGYEHFFA